MASLVKPQHRLQTAEILGYMQDIQATCHAVKDPEQLVNSVFNKILAWKKKAGDLDAQEKMIAR